MNHTQSRREKDVGELRFVNLSRCNLSFLLKLGLLLKQLHIYEQLRVATKELQNDM